MSLLNKPKWNIHRRNINDDEEEDNENKLMESDDIQNIKQTFKKKDKPKHTLLSFGEELEKANDGEVFKVKKSLRSKRLAKQLDQERAKKKGEEKLQVNSDTSEDEPADSRGHVFKAKSERSENRKTFPEEQGDENRKCRLLCEEDHDRSDEDSEERMNMTVNTNTLQKEKQRQPFLESQAPIKKLSAEECEPVEEQQIQQIIKGLSRAQITAAYKNFMIRSMEINATMLEPENPILVSNMIPAALPPAMTQSPDPTKCVPITPLEVLQKLRERLNNLKDVLVRHELNYETVEQEYTQSKKELEGLCSSSEIAQRYKYYQKLRGYVTGLVKCFDAKLPLVDALESRWIDLYGDRAIELMERRRQDATDQAEEVIRASRGPDVRRGPEDDARMRRATEKENRRARRQRARVLALASRHIDGMSSDDEITEQQNLIFRQAKEDIEKESRELFVDVEDDFSTLRGILTKLEDWRTIDPDTYNESYVSLCIPKMISPIIRLQIITWNPIMESAELERSDSFLLYGSTTKETEEFLQRDPNIHLIPSVIEKLIIPKLTTIVERIWDPMSTSQTLLLVGITNRLIKDYPNLNETSMELEALFNAIFEKIETAVENDVFIPTYPKQIMDPKHPFFQRQFTMAIKLLKNLLSCQGLIDDTKLKNIVLGSLLNKYLLAGLRVSPPADALLKANMIVSMLPQAWLQGETIKHLKMFATLI